MDWLRNILNEKIRKIDEEISCVCLYEIHIQLVNKKIAYKEILDLLEGRD